MSFVGANADQNLSLQRPGKDPNQSFDSRQVLSNKKVEELSVDEANEKRSLASYFSTLFVIFMAILLTLTIALFIWSNLSDGAYVSLQVTFHVPPANSTSDLTSQFTNATTTSVAQSAFIPIVVSLISDYQQQNNIDNMLPVSTILEDHNVYNQAIEESLTQLVTSGVIPQHFSIRIFHFGLVSSVSDFWQSEAYALALLIASFSGVWPYVKLIMLVICWFIPLKQKHREAILIFLDQMGKFSFIDLFVTLYMVVSFYVNLTIPSDHIPNINIRVVVEPDVGLNTFLIGTIVCTLFSHWFLYLDVMNAKKPSNAIKYKHKMDDKYAHLDDKMEDEYEDEHNIKTNPMIEKQTELWKKTEKKCNYPLFLMYSPSSFWGIFVRAFSMAVMLFTMYGVVYVIYSAPVRYDIKGVVGVFLGSDAHRASTPLEIVRQVPSDTNKKVAGHYLAAALFSTIVLFPIVQMSLIVISWIVPMNIKMLHYMDIAIQICMAWAGLDVFIVASIAASLELAKVSQWIIDQNYDKICGAGGVIENITGIQCFSVNGSLIPGTWVLVSVSVSLWYMFGYTVYQIYFAKRHCQQTAMKKQLDQTVFFFDH